jgi:hypothetical protein
MATIPAERLLVLLNGVLAGCMAAIIVAYGKLMWNALTGVHGYDRVRQMTLGFFLCWTCVATSLLASIYVRAADIPAPALLIVCVGRFLAITAAVLQVTAPDFGLGLFHGRDRKVLTASVIIGLLVAVAVVYGQEATVLAQLMGTYT